MGVVFEEDSQYASPPVMNSSASAGGLIAFLLRTGVAKTESSANTLAIALAIVFLVVAAFLYFSFGRVPPRPAVPEELINTPQPTHSL